MSRLPGVILAIGRVVKDTPGALRVRFRMHGVAGTVRVIPEMVMTVARHYFRPALRPPAAFPVVHPGTAPVADQRAPYERWIHNNGWTPKRRNELHARLACIETPLARVSVVLLVRDAPAAWLQGTIESVSRQASYHWDLLVAADEELRHDLRAILKEWQANDPRVHVIEHPAGTPDSSAINAAAQQAEGQFLTFIDAGDELSPEALGEVGLQIAANPESDLLYSDHDLLDREGHRHSPAFKSDYAPEQLLSSAYFGRMLVIRRELFAEIGGLRAERDRAWEYDLALRASEKARCITHVQGVLYHRRAEQPAVPGPEMPADADTALLALQDALARRKVSGTAILPQWARDCRIGVFSCEFPDDGPSVTLIIPTRNGLELVRRCIESLKLTTYRNYSILVIDNDSDDPATLQYLQTSGARVLRLSCPGGRFSYAYLNNRAVEQCASDYVLLLNNDTEVIEPKWLSRMMGYAQIPGVGSVGAKLLYPDLRVQHAGIVHSGAECAMPWHVFKLLPDESPGYMGWSRTTRNVAAATAACLVTPRELYLKLGGLDEQKFKVAYNDVDYGYRLVEAGFRNVYCATAVLKHYEGVSRGRTDNPDEFMAVRDLWGKWKDPYLSRHLLIADHEVTIA